MWCFVEFEEIVQAARCMKVLQVRAKPQFSRKRYATPLPAASAAPLQA